jgi:hypothetical protein
MKITGGRQRMWIGAWMLATLLLGGLNAYWFMVLEHQPLAGYSQTIRTLQTQLVKFDSMLSAGALSFNTNSDLGALFNPSQVAGNKGGDPTAPRTGAGTQTRKPDPTALPALSGIVQVIGPHGSLNFQAVLNGRVYRKKDKIDDYTVDQISPTGVVLRRSDGKWFIKSPNPFYSSDQGE